MADRWPVWFDDDERRLVTRLLEGALSGGSIPEWDQDVCDALRALTDDARPWLTVDDTGRVVRMVPATVDGTSHVYGRPGDPMYRAVPLEDVDI